MTTRILLLITDLELGGTPTVVRELAIRARDASPAAEIEVACLSKWGPVADQLREAGITVTALGARGPADLFTALPKLIHLIREKKIDVVFSFLMHANAMAAVASIGLRDVRWIQSIQTTQPNPGWHWPVQRLAQRAAVIIVVPSPSVARIAIDWAAVPEEKIVVIPNAIDPADWPPIPRLAVAPQGHDPERPYPITFLGRLDPIKDIPTLISAVALLDGLVHLHIYGEGSDRHRIQAAIINGGLEKRITMHGAIDRPQTALENSGLLVLPSLAEGFGLVLIEAMAAGVPVVATDVAGIRDVVRDRQTGLLVRPRDPQAMANAIRSIVMDEGLRKSLITNAAADVRLRFTWDVALEKYRAVLRV